MPAQGAPPLEGIEVGYGDIYSPLKKGEYIDISGVPYGDYDLVNRVNVDSGGELCEQRRLAADQAAAAGRAG
jgi:hypothetical protein